MLGFAAGEYSGAEAQERWQEQDPRDLWRAAVASMRAAVAQAKLDPRACAGLSVGGALHSVMALDRHGAPLTGVITWADGRAVAQAEAVRRQELAGQLYRLTGCPAHGMYPLYKIIWLAEKKPEVFEAASRYVTAKEYLFARLTGEHMVDYCLAAGSGLLNTHTLAWEPLCLETAGIRAEQLSAPCPPLTVVPKLAADAARQMGLPVEVPVVLGSSDAANSNIGAGAVWPWQATCMVGTSGAFRVIHSQPVLDPAARTWCYVVDERHWLVGGAINNGGVTLSWLRDCLNQAHAGTPAHPGLSFEGLLALAGGAPAGAGGLVCLPFFAGERSPNWNLNARAVFFGLSLSHGAAHLCRALVEAIALRFKNLSAILAEIGVDARQVVASGGFTQSDFWLQTVTDAINREMVVPAWGETSCLGAAYRPLTRTIAYSAAKAAVSNFTQWLAVHMAREYAPGIRVNALAPGFFHTAQNHYLLYDQESGALTARGRTIIDHTPMQRFGTPEDLLGATLWLLSPAAGFVTGTMVAIDGGFSAFSGV